MARTRSGNIAEAIRKALTRGTLTSAGNLVGAGGVNVYATISQLPLSGVTAGTQAYITATNRLYVHNGTGWYAINVGDAYSAFPTVMEFYLWGGGGEGGMQYSTNGSGAGGGGGFTYGELASPANSIGTTYTLKVNAGGGFAYSGGIGGGYTGVFTSATISQANAALIAGGGGGGAANQGGAGGGLTGQNGAFNSNAGEGYGGSQSAGGGWRNTPYNDPGGSGSALTGFSQNSAGGPGNGSYSGGGGGGYFGGGGGGKYYGGGAGGGGSGYVDSAEFVNSYTQVGSNATPANSSSSLRNGRGEGGSAQQTSAPTKGIAVIRYESGTAVATGGTITTDGSYIVHTFDSDGSFYITG